VRGASGAKAPRQLPALNVRAKARSLQLKPALQLKAALQLKLAPSNWSRPFDWSPHLST